MWHFQKIDLLKFLSNSQFISFVGSGGKTTFMEICAKRLLMSGKSVVITTTTKIYAKEPYLLIDDKLNRIKKPDFVRVGKTLANGKLTGLEFGEIERLAGLYDVVLVEADGAKGRPLKFPAGHEPVIPTFSNKICVLSGLDALYGRVEDTVFRWELFREATGIGGFDAVTPEIFVRCFSADAMLKGVDSKRCSVFLNKYDVLKNRGFALGIAKEIIKTTGVPDVIISSAFFDVFYQTEKIH